MTNTSPERLQELSVRAEAFLFSEGGAIAFPKLSKLLECSKSELASALDALKGRLENGGTTLILTETEASLAVSASASATVEQAFEKELGREIGSAGLEVLAIILYRGPSTRAHIDYIRGVNTSWTIRTLVARKLLERTANPDDAREFLYRPTTELMAHLGVTSAGELPDYASIKSELAAFESAKEPESE